MRDSVLSPALGRLAAPPRDDPFEPVRLALVDTLVSAQAKAPLEGGAWLTAWQQAMESIRDLVMAEAAAVIQGAALRSKFPAAQFATLQPNAETAEVLLNRLLAEGEPLERLDGPGSDDALTRARGAMLQAGWDAAIRIAGGERAHWSGVARDIATWRRPWRPLVIVAVVTLSLTLILAAMLGGVLPAPGWFAPVSAWFWNLPWP